MDGDLIGFDLYSPATRKARKDGFDKMIAEIKIVDKYFAACDKLHPNSEQSQLNDDDYWAACDKKILNFSLLKKGKVKPRKVLNRKNKVLKQHASYTTSRRRRINRWSKKVQIKKKATPKNKPSRSTDPVISASSLKEDYKLMSEVLFFGKHDCTTDFNVLKSNYTRQIKRSLCETGQDYSADITLDGTLEKHKSKQKVNRCALPKNKYVLNDILTDSDSGDEGMSLWDDILNLDESINPMDLNIDCSPTKLLRGAYEKNKEELFQAVELCKKKYANLEEKIDQLHEHSKYIGSLYFSNLVLRRGKYYDCCAEYNGLLGDEIYRLCQIVTKEIVIVLEEYLKDMYSTACLIYLKQHK